MWGQVSGAESWEDPQIPESTTWARPIPGRYQTLRPRARTLSPLAVKPLLLAAAPLSLQMKGQELPAPSAFRGRLNGSWKADLKHHNQAKDGCYVVLLGPKGLRVPGAPGLHFPEFRGEIFAVQPYYTCSMRAYRRRKWQHIPVFLTGKPHGWRSLVGYSPWSRKESDTILSDFTLWESTRSFGLHIPEFKGSACGPYTLPPSWTTLPAKVLAENRQSVTPWWGSGQCPWFSLPLTPKVSGKCLAILPRQP